eukprot:4047291-Alexandrium_andersonii.AAC.1
MPAPDTQRARFRSHAFRAPRRTPPGEVGVPGAAVHRAGEEQLQETASPCCLLYTSPSPRD